jgi:hypothetical protein
MATANHVLLRRITLTASTTSVTFDSIPQTGYTDLKVVASARADQVDGGTASWMSTIVKINGSSTGSHRFIYSDGSAANSSSNASVLWTYTAGSNVTANTFGSLELYLPNYASTTQYKSYSIDAVTENNATLSGIWMDAGLVSNNAAVTSIGFTPNAGNFVAGSSFSLYGLADVNTTPTVIPKAMGGDIVNTDGTYWYHAFTSTGVFKPETNLTTDVFMVAGGGGGGARVGGGGGAGGYRLITGVSTTATPYTITIGAGGAGQLYAGANATSGVNSTAIGYSVTGGGYGGMYAGSQNGAAGGSGGGANGNATTTGSAGNTGGYSPVEGYSGGNSTFVPTQAGAGGGGGANGAGGNGVGGTAGNGGAGIAVSAAWLAATGIGYSGYIAGGGGGGTESGYTPGTAGIGGGGTGSSSASAATSGRDNTGGGGGGGGCCSSNQNGGNGGSGIIIIRYPV